jgi:hypothetical protein
MSRGGSALLANWMLMAILLRVSDQARRPEPVEDPVARAAAASAETQVVRLP